MEKGKAKINKTAEQESMVQAFLERKSFIGEAVAGAGKSSTIKMMIEAAPRKKILCLAFNSDIVKTSRKTAPMNADWKTIHGLAFSHTPASIKNRLVHNPIEIWNKYENYIYQNKHLIEMIDKILEARSEIFKEKKSFRDKTSDRRKVIQYIRNTIVNHEQSGDPEIKWNHFPEDARHQMLFKLYQQNDTVRINPELIIKESIVDPVVAISQEIWYESVKEESSIPITHSTYLKLFGIFAPQLDYDCIMIDEAQDIMPVARQIVEVNRDTQRIWIGDGNQQIYGWNGAKNVLKNIDLPLMTLSQSFRYGQDLADYANIILKAKKRMDIGAFVQEIRGSVELKTKVNLSGIEKETPDAIITRTNAGIISAAIDAIEANKKIAVVGGISSFKNHLMEAYRLKKMGKVNNGEFSNFGTWSDLVEFSKSIDGQQYSTTVKLIEKYQDFLPDMVERIEKYVVKNGAKGSITLTTGHKAKGLEWDKVRIHDDFSPFVKKKNGMTIYSEEEANLMYVVATRAKNEANLVNLDRVMKETWSGILEDEVRK